MPAGRLARQELGGFTLTPVINAALVNMAKQMRIAHMSLNLGRLREVRRAYRVLLGDLRLIGITASMLPMIFNQMEFQYRYWLVMGTEEAFKPYDVPVGPVRWNLSRKGFGKIEYRQWDAVRRTWVWTRASGSKANSKKKRREANDAKFGSGGWRYLSN